MRRHPLLPVLILLVLLAGLVAPPVTALDPPSMDVTRFPAGVQESVRAGIAARERGDLGTALERYTQAWQRLDEHSHREARVRLGLWVGELGVELGRLDEARDVLTEVEEIARQAGNAVDRCHALVRLGMCEAALGNEATALTKMQQADTAAPSGTGHQELQAYVKINLGDAYLRLGRATQAAQVLREGHELARQSNERELLAQANVQMALLYELVGSDEHAREWFQNALDSLAGNPARSAKRERARACIAYSEYLFRQYDLPSSDNMLSRAGALYRDIDDMRGRAKVLQVLGRRYFDRGNFERATQAFGLSISALREGEITDPALEATSHGWLARTAIAMGDLQMARRELDLAYDVLGEEGSVRVRALLLRTEGRLAQARGEYQQAIDHREQGVRLSYTIGDRRAEMEALIELADLYMTLGTLTQAYEYLGQAAILADGTNDRDLARVLVSQGEALMRAEDPETRREANAVFRRAQRLAEDLGDDRLSAEIYRNLARLFQGLGQSNQAVQMTDLALQNAESSDPRLKADVLALKANLHLEQGDLSLARTALTEATDLAESLNHQGILGRVRQQLGALAWRQGMPREALAHYQAAAEALERSRAGLVSKESKTALMAQNVAVYSAIIDLLVEIGDTAGAFHWSERAKARSFLDQLAESRANVRTGVDPNLLKAERSVLTRLTNLQASRTRLVQAGGGEAALARIDTDIRETEREFETLQARIKRESPAYAALRYPQPTDMAGIRNRLAPGQLFIAYKLSPETSHAWAIGSRSAVHAELPGRDEIGRLVGYQRDLIVTGAQIAMPELVRNSRRLGEVLLDPFRNLLETHNDVIIAPDGVLAYLPFETLLLDDPGPAVDSYRALPYLITRVGQVTYVQSGTVFLTLEPGNQSPESFLTVLGHPIFRDERARIAATREAIGLVEGLPASRLPRSEGDTRELLRAMRSAGVNVPDRFQRNDRFIDPWGRPFRYTYGGSGQFGLTSAGYDGEFETADDVTREMEMSAVSGDWRDALSQEIWAPLPNTAREVQTILSVANGEAEDGGIASALRGEATEEFLKANAPGARYLHIATHGLLDEENPNFSGIILSADADEREDGTLYLVEVFNMQLSADLVVLSACETGLGRLVNGEGVEGLTRAFMYAGAPRLVVSLWSVDDASTATLMAGFYRNLWGRAQDPAVALAAAKRTMIASGEYSAPYFWSPFVITGAR